MKKFYTANEAAEVLKIHPQTVRQKIKKHEIHAVKFGGQWRISEDEIVRLLGGK